ncbi:hypothetical protein GCM10009801_77250 [Streptomyces albiaxialis]|uniref:Uncharacterized protein n=1 Tax=Streptomyces albiaxialis TaxID=329523 RepID=A0ABP5ILU6_9ACTN
MDMTPNPAIELAEPPSSPSTGCLQAPHAPDAAPPSAPPALTEPKGCLYALSQPPLMLFLAVIAILLALTGAHDLLLL